MPLKESVKKEIMRLHGRGFNPREIQVQFPLIPLNVLQKFIHASLRAASSAAAHRLALKYRQQERKHLNSLENEIQKALGKAKPEASKEVTPKPYFPVNPHPDFIYDEVLEDAAFMGAFKHNDLTHIKERHNLDRKAFDKVLTSLVEQGKLQRINQTQFRLTNG